MKIKKTIELLKENLAHAKYSPSWQRNNQEIEMNETIFPLLNKKETVNHPQHYNITGRKECIEEMIDIYGIDAVITFCNLNAYKYKYRHELKNGDEDLQKADWYYSKILSLLEVKRNKK